MRVFRRIPVPEPRIGCGDFGRKSHDRVENWSTHSAVDVVRPVARSSQVGSVVVSDSVVFRSVSHAGPWRMRVHGVFVSVSPFAACRPWTEPMEVIAVTSVESLRGGRNANAEMFSWEELPELLAAEELCECSGDGLTVTVGALDPVRAAKDDDDIDDDEGEDEEDDEEDDEELDDEDDDEDEELDDEEWEEVDDDEDEDEEDEDGDEDEEEDDDDEEWDDDEEDWDEEEEDEDDDDEDEDEDEDDDDD